MPSQTIISATGVYHPSQIIDNDELVTSFNRYVDQFNHQNKQKINSGHLKALEYSSSEFIFKASGIKQRYVLDKEGILDINRMRPYFPPREDGQISLQAKFAVKGIEKALEKSKRQAKDIDCIIMACSSHQRAYPAISIEVQQALAMKGFALDMNVACSSATFGISVGANMIDSGSANAVMVVTPEICTGHIDFTNRESHFIFGDACTAVLLENKNSASTRKGWQIKSTHLATQFSNNIRNNQGFLNACEKSNSGDPKHPLFSQNGKRVFKEVVPLAFEHILAHCEKHQLNSHDIKRYWLHQANSHMNGLIAKKLLGTEALQDKAPLILDQYANTAACGSIIAFESHQQDMNQGDLGMICSFGAGYSIGSILLEKR